MVVNLTLVTISVVVLPIFTISFFAFSSSDLYDSIFCASSCRVTLDFSMPRFFWLSFDAKTSA